MTAKAVLEQLFLIEKFPSQTMRKQIGKDLRVSQRQVQIWFQNRRQRERILNRFFERQSNLQTFQNAISHGTSILGHMGHPSSAPEIPFAFDATRPAPLEANIMQHAKTARAYPTVNLHTSVTHIPAMTTGLQACHTFHPKLHLASPFMDTQMGLHHSEVVQATLGSVVTLPAIAMSNVCR